MGCCSAARRARFESVVPVLCSGFLWADGCADSTYCEVSFPFFSTGSFCDFGFSVFLSLFVVVVFDGGLALSFVLMSAIFIR